MTAKPYKMLNPDQVPPRPWLIGKKARMKIDVPSFNFVDGCLGSAVLSIDAEFGKGYAKDHPELVGAFLQAVATTELALFTKQVADALQDADAPYFDKAGHE
jgi:hypothetical protein